MAYSLRTDKYRFIAWMDKNNKDQEPLMIELYEYDDSLIEIQNIASQHPHLVAQLLEKTRQLLK